MTTNNKRPMAMGYLACSGGTTDFVTVPDGELWVVRTLSGLYEGAMTDSDYGQIILTNGSENVTIFTFNSNLPNTNSYTLNGYWVLDASTSLEIAGVGAVTLFQCFAAGDAVTIY